MKFALTALLLCAAPALAESPNCGPLADVDAGLHHNYGETRQTIGLAINGWLMLTYANLETGTWSLVAIRPDGIACMAAAGESFQIIAEPPGEDS